MFSSETGTQRGVCRSLYQNAIFFIVWGPKGGGGSSKQRTMKLLSLAGYFLFPTISTTCYETCIHNIQLQSCFDSRGRTWVNTMVVKNFVVLLFVSCFAVIDPNKHTCIHTYKYYEFYFIIIAAISDILPMFSVDTARYWTHTTLDWRSHDSSTYLHCITWYHRTIYGEAKVPTPFML